MEQIFHVLVPVVLVLGTVALMEGVAAWSHRHIMHGWGWAWHKSHHEPHDHAFEKNDLYGLVFAGVAIALFVAGMWWWPLTWIATGVTLYGVLYYVLHDGLVHQRWPFRYIPRKGYLKRLYQAHRLHHAVKGKDGAVSFGFLYAPPVEQLVSELQSGRKAFDRDALDESKTTDIR